MLFNSLHYLAFLPLALISVWLLGTRARLRLCVPWLVALSLAFYAWRAPTTLVWIAASVGVNYGLSRLLGCGRYPRLVLRLGVAANLLLLASLKYAGFFVATLNAWSGADVQFAAMPFTPLAISFVTFQQISYLVDMYRGDAPAAGFLNYCLYVLFFPQLVAGPIVRGKEILPQFVEADAFKPRAGNLTVGISMFIIGLFKKVILADGVARFATLAFSAAEAGTAVTLLEGWFGALAFALQILLDFSGYTDMALGSARLFGIKLPLNFLAPYRSASIIEFWRRWHVTLSRFLRDYLYIPLGGNRKGKFRRYLNLMITMLLGGLWHGAHWGFVIWGGLHGVLLAINHGWRELRARKPDRRQPGARRLAVVLSVGLTFVATVVLWVFFRAQNLDGALVMLRGMSGLNGLAIPKGWVQLLPKGAQGVLSGALSPAAVPELLTKETLLWVFGLLVATFAVPSTMEIMGRYQPALDYTSRGHPRLSWKPSVIWAALLSLMLFVALKSLLFAPETQFLYFNF